MMQDRKIHILGLLTVRNESLILADTLGHLSQFTDGLVVFDDASEDNTLNVLESHPHVLKIVRNRKWDSERVTAETKNRQAVLEAALPFDPEWFFYADADERFIGDIKGFLTSSGAQEFDGIRISLFDAYLTPDDQKPYRGGPLLNFRSFFGPERRDILMIWKNRPDVAFKGLAIREPVVQGKIIAKFYCQHYGKSLSVEHWEETCDYYMNFFPPFAQKWKERKGKAIHVQSDFGTPLYRWEEVMKNSIKIFP